MEGKSSNGAEGCVTLCLRIRIGIEILPFMRNYYITKNESSVGPFSIDQLKHQGILPETKVWYEGLPDWVEARTLAELSELFPLVAAVPPPIRDVESEQLGRSTFFWRIAAVGTFLLMVVIAIWRLNGGTLSDIFPPNPEPVVPVDPPEPIPNPDIIVNPTPTPSREDNKKEEYRKNWRKYVSVEIDKDRIKYDDFGGMSDVFLRITNNMPYEIEFIDVEVSYHLQSGKVWKSPHFQFEKIPQASTLFQIDGSHRGKFIVPYITEIVCKEIGITKEGF